jgi:hypothetical protein
VAVMVQVLEQPRPGTHRSLREAAFRSRRKVGLPMPMSLSLRPLPLVTAVQRRVGRSVLLLFTETREDPQEQETLVCLSEPISLRRRTILEGLSIQSLLVNSYSYRDSKPSTISLSSPVKVRVRSHRLRLNSNALRHLSAWDRVLSTCRQPLVFSLLINMEVKTRTHHINPRLRTAGSIL